MRIFIRHGPKAYANGHSETYAHDPPLTEEGPELCRQKALQLLKSYGRPSVIRYSPYLRTRQTAEAMASQIPGGCPMICDVRLSEYLGNHRTVPLDVYPETAILSPPHPENYHQFTYRVKTFFTDPSIQEYEWNVTHGLVIKVVEKFFRRSSNRVSIPYLGIKVFPLYVERNVSLEVPEKPREVERTVCPESPTDG